MTTEAFDRIDRTLTRERVFALCDVLLAENKPVTQAGIRNANGGVGSNTTIVKYLNMWREQRTKGPEKKAELPDSIANAILDHINREVNEGKAQLSADLANAREERDTLIADSETYQAEIAEQAAQLQALQGTIERQNGIIDTLRNDVAIAKEEAASERLTLETARRELVAAQLRFEAMPKLEARITELVQQNSDLNNVRVELATMTAQAAAAEQKAKAEQESHNAFKKETAQRLTDAQAETASLRKALAEATAKAHDAEMRAVRAESTKAKEKTPTKAAPVKTTPKTKAT